MYRLFFLCVLLPAVTLADPAMECSDASSQVEISDCLIDTETRVESALREAVSFANDAALELDEVTGRSVAQPALELSQASWDGYRQAHCDYIGTTFGGGSGTGIAIRACRITLTRTRITELMALVQ